ncbi:MAG TPA: GNAT family N-acetyltransferase [Acidimicrobiia bacterium]|nr:GNAT family N-acetyltransferase [Acidimicrobiia bacterium]
MSEIIRPAVVEDAEQIAGWTHETFAWGDYVADALPRWVDDEASMPVVAEVDGAVVALASVAMMSADEAWGQGMRVHPDHRRSGLAIRVSDRLWEWARDRGARVVRLTVEEWNIPARGQAAKMGFRPVCEWVMAERGVGASSPSPIGNGGKRVPAPESIRPAHSAEAEPALMSWSTGPLEHASRGLFPASGWRWRRLRPGDLVGAARDRTLWEGRPGWAIAHIDAGTFVVRWFETSEGDARAMILALIDRAADLGVDRLEVFAPAVDWLEQALRYFGAELRPLTVYARVL